MLGKVILNVFSLIFIKLRMFLGQLKCICPDRISDFITRSRKHANSTVFIPLLTLLKYLENVILHLPLDYQRRHLEVPQHYRKEQIKHNDLAKEHEDDEERDGRLPIRQVRLVHHLVPLVPDEDLEHGDQRQEQRVKVLPRHFTFGIVHPVLVEDELSGKCFHS